MKKYKVGLLIGRFQPFHKGHLWLIRHALESIDSLIIGIGSANQKNQGNNFLSYDERKEVLQTVITNEKLQTKVLKIVPLDDFYDDERWFQNTVKQSGKIDIIFGNNEWVNGIFEKRGYAILRPGHFKRYLYEGERIRKLIKEGKKWQDRIPRYLLRIAHYRILFDNIILGGTFDHFHIGHQKLIKRAFEQGDKVTIGIAQENLYKNKFLAATIEDFQTRKKSVSEFLKKNNWLSRSRLVPISDIFGPALTNSDFDAIIASTASYKNTLKVNEERKKVGLSSLKIIKVPDVLAQDGKLVTSERIRSGEIDREGKSYFAILKKKNLLVLPQEMRSELKRPLGQVFKGGEDELEKTARLLLSNIKIEQNLVIAVGDIVSLALERIGFKPPIKIIDLRSRRKKFTPAQSRIFYSGGSPSTGSQVEKIRHFRLTNNPGTINSGIGGIFQSTLKKYFATKEQQVIVVNGEEDLVTLPAILLAPLESVVVYGQMDLGVIAVLITEQKKKEIEAIVQRFQ